MSGGPFDCATPAAAGYCGRRVGVLVVLIAFAVAADVLLARNRGFMTKDKKLMTKKKTQITAAATTNTTASNIDSPIGAVGSSSNRTIDADESLGSSSSSLTNASAAEVAAAKVHETRPRPPLDTLIRGIEITGDVDFLLDFAILGHAKAGTTTAMRWIASHPEVQMTNQEIRYLEHKDPVGMVKYLYKLEEGPYKRGYKSPQDITKANSIQYLGRHWPSAGLIVGIRHPVLLFESLYNYRIRGNVRLGPPESRIGSGCGGWEVCTDATLYHVHLSYFGKTNWSHPEEQKLLTDGGQRSVKAPPAQVPNKIFLYDLSQMNNASIADQFRADLSKFIGLKTVLGPIIKENAAKNSTPPGLLNICEEQHHRLRSILMDIAKNASTWIRNFFVKSPDVVVSSPQAFDEILRSYMNDPCDNRLLRNNL